MFQVPKIDPEIIREMFANWCPFPDKWYCNRMGWTINADGTVDTPGGFRIPTSELWEERKLRH